jgi:hypothetical protein
MPPIYKTEYYPLSVYGNVVSLLREHVSGGGVHLDIGCGYGAIAEPIRDELGLIYIGFDLADDGMASLRERGFETHRIDLADPAGCEAAVTQAVGNRRVASLSFLDTLEHLTNGEQVLAALRRVAVPSNAPLATSVPNVAHRDLALKLLLGRWDVTEDGLLDQTHVTLYTHERLARLMKSVGWRRHASRDWTLERSDQHFPKASPVLNGATPVGKFLTALIERANPYGTINQFIGLYLPDEPSPQRLLHDRSEPYAPFVSVVLSVGDWRSEHARRLVHDLANQPSHDFELVILHSSADPEAEIQQGLLGDLPILQGRSRLVSTAGLSRLAALNAAVARCCGRYFTILDDAAGLHPSWIFSVAALDEKAPGTVLQVQEVPGDGAAAAASVLADDTADPATLPAFWRFVRGEHGCFATLAFPTSAVHELGLRFELALPDGRGWDLAIDTILCCGLSVSPAPGITPLRLDGLAAPTGSLLDGAEELRRRLGERPILIPSAAAGRVARLYGLTDLIKDKPALRSLIDAYWPHQDVVAPPADDDAPFLSVITRTQGRRPHTLRDTLMSLAGQTSPDFEVVLVVHSESPTIKNSVGDIVDEFPPDLRARINLISCGRPGRSSPLNDGIARARGRYIALLDDDDIALAHWVETFKKLAADAPAGMLLRATCVRQDFDLANPSEGAPVPRAKSWFQLEWPSSYDALQHAYSNATPPMCMAYPVAVFREDGLRFDETLSTVEDWDLMVRAAVLRGVASTSAVTAIYRWGAASDVSTTIHTSGEWQANHAAVQRKLASAPYLLPQGAVTTLNALQERYLYLANQVIMAGGTVPWIDEDPRLIEISRAALYGHLNSLSWRLTRKLMRPLRRLHSRFTGRPLHELTPADIPASAGQRVRMIRAIRSSLSWKLSIPIRLVARLARRASRRR